MVKDREELPLEDSKVVQQYVNDEVLVRIEHEQAIVVLLGNKRERVQHPDGTSYWLLPHSFSACPTSIARDYMDRDDAVVLTMKEAQKYIKMSVEASNEANKDIIEYNMKAKKHNDDLRLRKIMDKPKMVLKKKRLLQNNGPYHHLLRDIEARKEKVSKPKKSKKTSEKDTVI